MQAAVIGEHDIARVLQWPSHGRVAPNMEPVSPAEPQNPVEVPGLKAVVGDGFGWRWLWNQVCLPGKQGKECVCMRRCRGKPLEHIAV